MNLAAFLIGMVGPLVARVLVSLGVSLVTIAGLTAATAALKGYVTSAIGGLPAVAVQLAGLYGAWTCLGMIFGTITFCVTWQSTKGFWALAKT